jgi:hypothetical protein
MRVAALLDALDDDGAFCFFRTHGTSRVRDRFAIARAREVI